MNAMVKSLDTSLTRAVLATDGGPSALDALGCGSLPGARWYAVGINPGQENLARPALHRLGFSTFFPTIRVAIRDRRVGKRVCLQPAFPGYMFAEWAPGQVWQRILSRPGVSGILHAVGDQTKPLPVPRSQMAALMARASEGGVIEDASVAPVLSPIEPGRTVRLTDGPLAGRVGLCQFSSAERVSILLTLMGCERPVEAKRRFVEAV